MKFDIFCEIQRAKPWEENHELALLQDTLDQAQQADRCGFDIWWQVEHHGAPQFSYSAAPEVVLTAIAMRSKRMHVGHAGVLAPFKINGPLRVAERGATIDLLSGGRFELGLAKTGGKEWETFGVDPAMARGCGILRTGLDRKITRTADSAATPDEASGPRDLVGREQIQGTAFVSLAPAIPI